MVRCGCRQRHVARHTGRGQGRSVISVKVNIEGVLWDAVKGDGCRSPACITAATHNFHRLQVRMHHDQGVSRLRPTHIIDHVAGDSSGQIVVAASVDVGHRHAILDDVHPLMREAQHIAVGHRELEGH